MKFDELTDEDVKKVGKIYNDKETSWDERIKTLSQFFDKSERTTRKWLVKLGFKHKENPDSEELKRAKAREFNKDKKRFIITWAQNATGVHKGFMRLIEHYAKHIDADIHVIAGRYRNPTSIWTQNNEEEEWWAEEVSEYLDAARHEIHKWCEVLSDVKVPPTATNPMSGLNGLTGGQSCIIGHPRVHLEALPALKGNLPKLMLTTGACTLKNYTDSKSGKKGEFHHTFGFVIVEIKDKETYYVRQVTADDTTGSFVDYNRKVFFNENSEPEIKKVKKVKAAILGDLHHGKHDQEVMKATKKIFKDLKPEKTFIHDVFDGESISHHEEKNPIIQFHKEVDNRNSLGKELDKMLKWLEDWKKYNLVLVRSNHDDFVDRWIINADWKKHIKNSLEYMEFATMLLNDRESKGVIPYVVEKRFGDEILCLGRDESFKIGPWELGYHGDQGSNGSRGSLEQFRKLNTKVVVGHYHTPGRKDGALAVGTSTYLRIGYNKGASGWLNSHVLIHEDMRAQHIHIIKDASGNYGHTTIS